MLVAGNVIIGRKDESEGTKDVEQDGTGTGDTASVASSAEGLAEDGLGTYRRVPTGQAEGSGSRARQDYGVPVVDDVEKEDGDKDSAGR